MRSHPLITVPAEPVAIYVQSVEGGGVFCFAMVTVNVLYRGLMSTSASEIVKVTFLDSPGLKLAAFIVIVTSWKLEFAGIANPLEGSRV